jgi:mono/diheme cytochrome c family protein
VEGESWLVHLHRSFDETSMGKSSGVYGPAPPTPSEWPLPLPALQLSDKFTGQSTTLYGSDLYRFKCQGCHGASGTGAPPELFRADSKPGGRLDCPSIRNGKQFR